MNLNNLTDISRLDKEDALGSTLALADQCQDAWTQVKQVKLPKRYREIEQVIVAGMGGSNLGTRMIQGIYRDQFTAPIEIVNHYELPAYANRKTLVLASSYSGSTEESLMVAQQASKRGCKVVAMASGGRLIEWAKRKGHPFFAFQPTFNYSNQPRIGVGYTIFGKLGLFKQLGLMKLSEGEVKDVISHLRGLAEQWQADRPESINTAKQFALGLRGFAPIWVAAEHLEGNARVANNQTNETAKNFAFSFSIPELNHHLMEGLSNPTPLIKKLLFVLFDSDKYLARNQKRFAITKDVVEKNRVRTLVYRPTAQSKLGESCEVLLFSSMVTFYLAMLYGENPNAIPWVDYFKKKLAA